MPVVFLFDGGTYPAVFQGVVYKEYREGGERWEREREKLVEGKREMATLREQDQIRIQELAVSESGCVCVCVCV